MDTYAYTPTSTDKALRALTGFEIGMYFSLVCAFIWGTIKFCFNKDLQQMGGRMVQFNLISLVIVSLRLVEAIGYEIGYLSNTSENAKDADQAYEIAEIANSLCQNLKLVLGAGVCHQMIRMTLDICSNQPD